VIRVVKIGGRAQGDAALSGALAAAARASGWRLCVVHGGGDEVSDLQRRLGREPRFVGGRRYTSPEDVELVRMVLSGAVNKRLVRQLLAMGLPAVGISGEDAALLPAVPFQEGALGAVGISSSADRRLLDALLDAGFVPVVSPIGYDAASGEGLNINGDDAAAAIAVALGADELLLLADVPGVLDGAGKTIASVDLDQASALLGEGIASGGMAAKLEAAQRALAGGVRRVRIGDIAALRDGALGTSVTHSPTTV
jgi:acetylglutamate kinase